MHDEKGTRGPKDQQKYHHANNGSNDYFTTNDDTSSTYPHDAPPPEYTFHAKGPGMNADAVMEDDGRIKMNFDANKESPPIPEERIPYTPPNLSNKALPRLNIVIQIVGSRGDIQPFIALGNTLQVDGHNVRIATHDVFRDFVQQSGLSFFPIGGDPASLMAYMVKNPGIIPGLDTLFSGEIAQKRSMVKTMLQGCWRSCIEPDPETGDPFIAEVIIANPPSFAHVHCAQALGIPLHLMFTMPWSPTTAFPHPLANIERTHADPRSPYYLSYAIVEIMTWQGLASVFNSWRSKYLSLPPIAPSVGPLLCHNLKIPFTYCWSPGFVPKPADWPDYLDVCGFFFRKEPDHTPEDALRTFLEAGPPPVYIGFGSIVIDSPEKLTNTIITSVRALGVRAIVSRGWSKLGSNIDLSTCPDILFLGDCPHEWLFKQVSCVVHHGGAGTTACGLLNGCPTTIVPFFGDQAFWGQMIAAAGAGPQPIHHKLLNQENLTEAIRFCLTPSVKNATAIISKKIRKEEGVSTAVKSFQINLPVEQMTCDLLADQVAVWKYNHKDKENKKGVQLKLSDEAAFVLVEKKMIEAKRLQLYQSKPIDIDNFPWDPVTAGTRVLLSTLITFTAGFTDVLSSPIRGFQGSKDGKGGLNAAKSIGKGFGKMTMALPKATLVDFPLALTEGLHHMPKLYGEDVRDHGKVTDMKSAGVVAGKNFGYGFMDGLAGAVVKPYKGAKEDGWAGFGKGVAKGTMGLMTGPGSAMFGLFAYPFLGMYKSITTSSLSPAQKQILLAKQVYGSHMARQREQQHKEERSERVATVLRKWSERVAL